MKRITALLIFLSLSILITGPDFADESRPKCFEGVEFLTGFQWGKLHAQGAYHLTPFMADFDFSLKPALKKINLFPSQLVQFQLEPFISYVAQPYNDMELGNSFMLKIGILPQTSKFQPYVKAGVGIVYMTLQTREQSTQFNFAEQGGIGMHYFFRKSIAFTVEGRMRHLSNAGIKYPNHGINTYSAQTGLTFLF